MQIDRTGERFWKLVAIRPLLAGSLSDRTRWLFRCDCGKEQFMHRHNARAKGSCGCSKKPRKRPNLGRKTDPTYCTFNAMHQRCSNIKASGYHRYGGRGIRVCPRWESYENFLADMGNRPAGHSLDRIDVNGGYEPRNCRWATPKEQSRNRCDLIFIKGKTKAEWAEIYGLPYRTLVYRFRAGWTFEDATNTPVQLKTKRHFP